MKIWYVSRHPSMVIEYLVLYAGRKIEPTSLVNSVNNRYHLLEMIISARGGKWYQKTCKQLMRASLLRSARGIFALLFENRVAIRRCTGASTPYSSIVKELARNSLSF